MVEINISWFVVLLFLFSPFSHSAKSKKESEEEPVTEDNVNYLLELTDKISNCLEHPSSDNGTVLFRCLYEYYNELHGIYWMMKEKAKRIKAVAYVKKIIDHGLSVHLTKTINFDDTKDKYLWNDIIVREMNALIKDTKELWSKAQDLM